MTSLNIIAENGIANRCQFFKYIPPKIAIAAIGEKLGGCGNMRYKAAIKMSPLVKRRAFLDCKFELYICIMEILCEKIRRFIIKKKSFLNISPEKIIINFPEIVLHQLPPYILFLPLKLPDDTSGRLHHLPQICREYSSLLISLL